MKIRLMPRTLSGKWSVVLSILFIILIWLKMEYSIHVMTFAIAAIGLAGFIISIIAIVKNKDRSIISFLPVLVGLIIILWIIGEMIYPH
ncbi:MAG: hypothetical protein LIR50_03680 [Bacillota bacterium]|nr:hypothetical protein [Bacillota bacterium]